MAFAAVQIQDMARWRRQAQKYASAKKQWMTAATQMTEEAMEDGVYDAKANIAEYVYEAYEPKEYHRTGTLLQAVQERGPNSKTGQVSGSIFVSQAVLNTNTEGNPKKKPYQWFVERGVKPPSDGPWAQNMTVEELADWTAMGHFPREFWLHTIIDMREKIINEYGPQALQKLVSDLKAS